MHHKMFQPAENITLAIIAVKHFQTKLCWCITEWPNMQKIVRLLSLKLRLHIKICFDESDNGPTYEIIDCNYIIFLLHQRMYQHAEKSTHAISAFLTLKAKIFMMHEKLPTLAILICKVFVFRNYTSVHLNLRCPSLKQNRCAVPENEYHYFFAALQPIAAGEKKNILH